MKNQLKAAVDKFFKILQLSRFQLYTCHKYIRQSNEEKQAQTLPQTNVPQTNTSQNNCDQPKTHHDLSFF